MASGDNVGIGIAFEGVDEALEGITDLQDEIASLRETIDSLAVSENELENQQRQTTDSFNEMNRQAGELGSALGGGIRQIVDEMDLMSEKTEMVSNLIGSMASGDLVGTINASVKIGVDLWKETKEIMEGVVLEGKKYNEGLEFATKLLEDNKKAKESGKDKPFDPSSEKDREKRLLKQGARDLGYSEEGTWGRWFEDIGDMASSAVSGDDINANKRAAGVKDEAKNNQIAAWNAKEQKRRDDAKKAADDDMRQIELDDADRERVRLKETKEREKKREQAAKDADEAAMKQGRDYLAERGVEEGLEKRKGKSEETWERSQEMRAIRNQEKQTTYGVESGYDAAFKMISKGASKDGKTQEEIEKESNALKLDWHKEDIAKMDALIAASKGRQNKAMGLAAP